MPLLASLLIFILILSFLVLIHELGHFIVAKWAKINVEEFGLGYPPLARKLFTWKGTAFTLNWIPFGGFVKMQGEEGQPSSEVEQTGSAQPKTSGDFQSKSTAWRLAVIVAGASVNFVFGVIAFALIFSIMGIPTAMTEARVAAVLPGSPAEKSGLPTAVTIIALKTAGSTDPITTRQEAITKIAERTGETITLVTTGQCEGATCQEMAQEFQMYVRTPEELVAAGQNGAVGIAFQSEYFKFYPWYEMPIRGTLFGLAQAVQLSVLIVQTLGSTIADLFKNGTVPADIMGPIGIVDIATKNEALLRGPLAILQFAGLLSINLAIMNILPIPALDGGRALFIFLEKIFGKKRIAKIEGAAHYGGFIVLMILIVLISGRDIFRVFAGS